ncbi:MAG: flagellar motor switch protein FliG [Halocynthiibacter sp.]
MNAITAFDTAEVIPDKIRDEPLTGRMQAAIVTRVMLTEGIEIPLHLLPEQHQSILTEELGELRLVGKDTLKEVLNTFIRDLEEVGMAFSGGLAGALKLLDGKISTNTAGRLRKEVGLKTISDPWDRLATVAADALKTVIEREAVEIGAVMLSKLSVAKAAEVLDLLPAEKRNEITYAMSRTGPVAPDAVERIGIALTQQLDATPAKAFDSAPTDRVGAILNFSSAKTRDEVLAALDARDQSFANDVKKAIFTFENIPLRVVPTDVPKLTRGLDAALLRTALAGATEGASKIAADFILDNMSKRMADGLREEIEEIGKVKPADAEAGQSAIIVTIRELEENGELVLLDPTED